MSSKPPSPDAPTQSTDETVLDSPPVEVDTIRAALPSSPAPVEFTGVSKTYGNVTALHDTSITVRSGELHCMAGPNGSGKTTLGRIAVGLTTPTTGRVTGPTSDIGYGFQAPRFYPALTVQENLVTFCRASGVDPESPWVTEITEALRLNRVAHQPASDLSGGFQKKLDLAIALAETPTYIWLDEPLGDLDDVSVSRVIALLEAYVTAGGGVAVSTHNFDAFEGVFTHLTVFLDGVQHKTMELGEPECDDGLAEQYHNCLSTLYSESHLTDYGKRTGE